MTGPLAPSAPADWWGDTLAGVLPAVAGSLGVPAYAGEGMPASVHLPPAKRAVVVLVDGLGFDLLTARAGHAPFLRTLLPTARRLVCGFPSTTATSMGTFGTGLPPGAHGLVGYEVVDPATDTILNELSWENGPDPRAWQTEPTVFERAAADGVAVTRIGPGFFDGSGLTNAALRGGRFTAAQSLAARCEVTLECMTTAARAGERALAYLYWGDLDKVGHVHGCQSWQWGDELTAVDDALGDLARALPPGTSLTITADHGMVDVPHEARIDLAEEPALREGVRHVVGEPRSLQIHCRPGAVAEVCQRWRERLDAVAPGAWFATREEVAASGWLGPLDDRVAARVGDLFITLPEGVAVVDSARQRPEFLALIGWHGSLTAAETGIPLLTAPAS